MKITNKIVFKRNVFFLNLIYEIRTLFFKQKFSFSCMIGEFTVNCIVISKKNSNFYLTKRCVFINSFFSIIFYILICTYHMTRAADLNNN